MNLNSNCQRILYELFRQEYLENASHTNESHYFEFFASTQILKGKDLSDEEVELGVLGSGNDGGCDSVYTFFNECNMTEDLVTDLVSSKGSSIELVIIQAKRETSFSENTIMKWKTISQNLLEIGVTDSEYTARYNGDVLAAFSLFRELYVKLLRNTPKLTIRYCYATFAEGVHPNVTAQANELVELVKELFPSPRTNVVVEFWDASKLLMAAQSQAERQLSLTLSETPVNIGTHRDYVTLVNLGKYFKFISDESGNLRKYIFESNVRDYQGHNSVNQDIQATLDSNGPEDFWWLNNGITLLTDEAILATSKELVLTDPAVVNGLQTSNEIYQYFKAHPEKVENEVRNILVRIIVPESEESRDKIILATNNQTNIPKSSLRANDPIHWQIELFFRGRGLFYDRRKNYYKNQGKRSEEIVSVSFLAQCMISLLLQKPDYARARPSTLLTRDETYDALYGSEQNLDVFYNAALLGKRVEKYLKHSSAYTQAQKNDILFYVLFFSVAKYLNKVTIGANDIKDLDISVFTDGYINGIAQEVLNKYKSLGGNGKVAKSPDLTELLKSSITTA